MPVEIVHALRQARLGHALVDALPGASLRVARVGGPAVTIAGLGHADADLLPCQHRAALLRGLDTGLQRTYAHALGLTYGGALTYELLTPPGVDLGSGVYGLDLDGWRQLVVATTLCAHHAVEAARSAQTRPAPVTGPTSTDAGVGPVRVEVHRDPALEVTVLRWRHPAHPAIETYVEDAARAAAAACAVAELLGSLDR